MTNNDGWIEWVWSEEKPYPETEYTLVKIKCESDGYQEGDYFDPSEVGFWFNDRSAAGKIGNNIWEPNHYGSITHYKLAKGN